MGDTGAEESLLWPNCVFSGVIGMERVFVACGGNRFSVFSELALLCDNVFRVMTGPNLIFALPFLLFELSSPTLKLAICLSNCCCLSILANRLPLSKPSISSNWEKMSVGQWD